MKKKKKKKVKTSITVFVCLGLKRAEKKFGGYKKTRKTPFEKNTKKAPRIRTNQNFENRASSCSNQAQMTP